MRIIFWGTPQYSVASLKTLIESNHDVVAVISQPDKKRSRGKKLIPSPVKDIAENNNIPIFTPDIIKGNAHFLNILKSFYCDLFIVIAYGKILPQEILEIPKYGSWNAHASLLPRWRGAAPIQWSLMEGDNYTGVGIMKMDEGLDTGDLLIEEKIKINDEDNCVTLSEKLSLLSSKLLLTAISKIEKIHNFQNRKFLIKQKSLNREIKYARMINKEDYKIDWSNDAESILRRVKALYPRANIIFKGKNLKIINIQILEKDKSTFKKYNFKKNIFKPGFILAIDEDEGIIISTKTNPIILKVAKLEGKNISRKIQLIQQLRPEVGEKFSD